MKAYRIRDWSRLFENSETRKLKSLSWVPVPNKHDGAGYRALWENLPASPETPGDFRGAPEVFAGWILLLELASRCPERGLLVKDGRPMTPREMALKTGAPEKLFVVALKELTSREIGWIEVAEVEIPGNFPTSPETSGASPDIPGNFRGLPENLPTSPETSGAISEPTANDGDTKIPGNFRGLPENLPTSPETSGAKGIEGKGREQKGSKQRVGETASAAIAAPPSSAVQEFTLAWNAVGAPFKPLAQWTASRQKWLGARMKDSWWKEHWREGLERMRKSAFCRGETDHGTWMADVEFFLKPNSVAKLLEGKYDDRNGTGKVGVRHGASAGYSPEYKETHGDKFGGR